MENKLPEIERKIAAKAITALTSDYNELVSQLINLSDADQLDRIMTFRRNFAKTLDKYADDADCGRILKDLDKKEARIIRDIQQGVVKDFARLRVEVNNHLTRKEFFAAEQKVNEFKALHPDKYKPEIKQIFEDVTSQEKAYFDEVLRQAEDEIKAGRLSLAVSILLEYIRAQEGRKYITSARKMLEQYSARLEGIWKNNLSKGEAEEKAFNFDAAKQIYETLRRQVTFDENKLQKANELIEIVVAERVLFEQILQEIKKKVPMKLSFKLWKGLKGQAEDWVLSKADGGRIYLRYRTGMEQSHTWGQLDALPISRLIKAILGELNDKKALLAEARMMRVRGEDERAEELEALANKK